MKSIYQELILPKRIKGYFSLQQALEGVETIVLAVPTKAYP